ncbi:MAG TPA: bifunctional 5,10-methylenetetrahydrofolate dehydrogenase/5,10-methenyltetrahydrofolate cyclohydrolase [Candidatus Paceibacterota bacterium]|nr:bifunctional 5,10-methylenetetrahydrofolate dehydrogenase/5,10-methenyltetrahydrofolate cyclohydrolase [Candidatus Paceibacterota bacterium]
MIINGTQIANEILSGLRGSYTLGVVMGTDAASDSFVRMKERAAAKAGVQIVRYAPEDFDKALACDGVLVQLPLEGVDNLIAQLPPEKDVDALGPRPLVRAPVAEAIGEVLTRAGIDPTNKRAVVVGAGKLVGQPAAKLLADLGADVSVVTLEQGSLSELKDADIVVLGAGSPGIVKPDMLKPGVVLIDAGTSEAAGKLAGDADPACAEVASVFTPVPGGIGPIAVAMLFKNLFSLAQK